MTGRQECLFCVGLNFGFALNRFLLTSFRTTVKTRAKWRLHRWQSVLIGDRSALSSCPLPETKSRERAEPRSSNKALSQALPMNRVASASLPAGSGGTCLPARQVLAASPPHMGQGCPWNPPAGMRALRTRDSWSQCMLKRPCPLPGGEQRTEDRSPPQRGWRWI